MSLRVKVKSLKLKILLFALHLSLFTLLTGCEAFVRKFTRKPKKEEFSRNEIVLAPQEYKAHQMSREEVYRQYFLFWKSWQDELINALNQTNISSQNFNQKKCVDCADEALSNLMNLKPLLNEEKQKKMDACIGQLRDLRNSIAKDIYGYKVDIHRQRAERIRRDILRDLSYPKIKDCMV